MKPANTAPPAAASAAPTSYVNEDGKEVYGSEPPKTTTEDSSKTDTSAESAPAVASTPAPMAQPAVPVAVEEDDPATAVPEGARCKRLACGKAWEGEETSRGDGDGAKCRHHPQAVSP